MLNIRQVSEDDFVWLLTISLSCIILETCMIYQTFFFYFDFFTKLHFPTLRKLKTKVVNLEKRFVFVF